MRLRSRSQADHVPDAILLCIEATKVHELMSGGLRREEPSGAFEPLNFPPDVLILWKQQNTGMRAALSLPAVMQGSEIALTLRGDHRA